MESHLKAIRIFAAASIVSLNGCGALPEQGGLGTVVPLPHASYERQQGTAEPASTTSLLPSPTKNYGVAANEPEVIMDPGRVVFFEIADTGLSTKGREVIQKIAAQLYKKRSLAVTLIGRTDHLGSKEICIAIANKRLEVVEDELVRNGVKTKQIRNHVRGCEMATDRPCLSETCRRQRRSVELLIVEKS